MVVKPAQLKQLISIVLVTAIVAVTVLLLSTPARAASMGTYQLRLVVEVGGDSASIAVGAKFGSNPTIYRLAERGSQQSSEQGSRYTLQAETSTSGAVIYLSRAGIELRHDAVRWQGQPGGQTTVALRYQPDLIGGLRLVGMAQAEGIHDSLVISGDGQITAGDSTVDTNPTGENALPDPASAGGTDPPIGGTNGGDGSDAPTGFVAVNPPMGGTAQASPALPQPPTATKTLSITLTPSVTFTPNPSQTPTGGVNKGKSASSGSSSSEGKSASGGKSEGINWWIVVMGIALIAAGRYGPEYLSSASNETAHDKAIKAGVGKIEGGQQQ